MAKSNAERQKLYRTNLLKNKSKFEEMKRKARIRDNSRRQSSKGALFDQFRARQKQASKKYRDKKKLKNLNGHQSSYKCRQSLGKALKRTVHSLPKDSNKRIMVVQHLAQNLNIISKTTHQHTRQQRSLSIELKELVIQFYQRDDITYQLPGKRDYVTVTDDNGEKMTIQKRILLYNIRETYQLFVNEYSNKNIDLSLTSFNELRPENILINSYMPHRSCLCIYHENVNLLIKSLSKHISCDSLNSLQEFTSMLVCDEQEEKCMFSCCHLCSHNFDNNIMKNVINRTKRIQWFQWVLQDGKTKKIEFNDTINQCSLTLKEKIKPFLNHVFIKREQATFFEKMKIIPNDEIICIQVDFSENFRLCMQNAVQNSYYSQDAVSLFTTYVWYADGGESFVYISNNLTHDKYCVNASIDNLLKQLTQRFQHLQQIHIFSDGSSQQFKQKFLFRNICRLSQQHKVDLSWHYFATSHGKGVVDAVGGTLKRLVHRAIMSGERCTSAADFVKIAQSKTTTINVIELTQDCIDESKGQLEQLFKLTKSVPETKKVHSIKALQNNSIEHRYYSNSLTKKIFRFSV